MSLDIETTGLDPEKDQILEIGMVIEDTEASPLEPIEDLPAFSQIVRYDRIEGDPFALAMNARLIERIKDGQGVDLATSLGKAAGFLRANLGDPLYVIAGKNVAGFDLPFFPKAFRSLFRHRVIDAGAVALGADTSWWRGDYPPSLGALLDAGKSVAHTALVDAQDVVRVLRRLTGGYGSFDPRSHDACTFQDPKCPPCIEAHSKAMAAGMPPSGRHG